MLGDNGGECDPSDAVANKAKNSNITDSVDRPILYRTFFWGGDANDVHEGPGGLNWPMERLSELPNHGDSGRDGSGTAPPSFK
jgi:hypothetical protein